MGGGALGAEQWGRGEGRDTPVRSQHHRAPRLDEVENEVPEEAPGLGVHACGGLILGAVQAQPPQGAHPSWPTGCLPPRPSGGERSGRPPPRLTRKMKAGYPMRAMAVDSFLLLPPL